MKYILIFLLFVTVVFSAEEREPFEEISPNPPFSPVGLPDSRPTSGQNSHESGTGSRRYFDKDQYIRKTYDELQLQEQEMKIKHDRAMTCSNIFVVFSSISTATILIITVIGATQYIDPSLSNLLASICAACNGLFLWGSVQTKKMAQGYSQHRIRIQRVLNIPEKLIMPDASLSLDPFQK